MAVPFSELQSAAPSAIIELFQLELNVAQHGVNETHYFHSGGNLNGNGQIVWAGQTYLRWPIEASGFEYNGQGQLPRPTLRVSNVMGTITALILTLPNGLEGAKVTRIRTLARYLDGINFISLFSESLLLEDGGYLLREDGGRIALEPQNPTEDPTAEFPREVFYIDRKATENIEVVEFEMCAAFDLAGVRAPKRQCVSNVCQWEYRKNECPYTGNAYFNLNDNPVGTLAQDVCGKRLSSCEARFQQQRRTGSVSIGSNILTLTQPASFSTGEPVSGFGIPAGATVSSVSGSLVTLSTAAIATTALVRTGTIQSNYTQIVVTSTIGIVPGMAVSGAYLPANSQVVAVNGNTVFLSSPVDLTQFFSVVSSASGNATGSSIKFPDGTPIAVGWFVGSSRVPLSRRAQVVGIRRVTLIDTAAGSKHGRVATYTFADLNQHPGVAAAANIDLVSRSVTWTFYVENPIPAATYTFTATNQTYTFRTDSYLPYGSFPGVGTFFT